MLHVLLTTRYKEWFQQKQKHNKWQIFKVKNWSMSKLKTGPSMLRNKLDQFLTLKSVFFVVVFVLATFSKELVLEGTFLGRSCVSGFSVSVTI